MKIVDVVIGDLGKQDPDSDIIVEKAQFVGLPWMIARLSAPKDYELLCLGLHRWKTPITEWAATRTDQENEAYVAELADNGRLLSEEEIAPPFPLLGGSSLEVALPSEWVDPFLQFVTQQLEQFSDEAFLENPWYPARGETLPPDLMEEVGCISFQPDAKRARNLLECVTDGSAQILRAGRIKKHLALSIALVSPTLDWDAPVADEVNVYAAAIANVLRWPCLHGSANDALQARHFISDIPLEIDGSASGISWPGHRIGYRAQLSDLVTHLEKRFPVYLDEGPRAGSS